MSLYPFTAIVDQERLVHALLVNAVNPAVGGVLVEGPSRKDADVLTGRTRQNKLVHFAGGDERIAIGSYADVRITGAAPHHLRGDLVEVTARPRHKTRIPVAAL